MRLFFLMLLLLNGVFFAVNALHEPKIAQQDVFIDPKIAPLILLSEQIETTKIEQQSTKSKPEIIKREEEASLDLKTWLAKFTAENATTDETPEEPQQQESSIKEQMFCYTAGPFKTKDTLKQATLYASDIGIQSQQRSIEENQYIGMLVYLPSQASRNDVVAIAEKLASKGVKDYMLLNEPGKEYSLSLGVYGLKKNADQRIKALSKLNYQAESEARYRKKTVYWLDYSFTESNNQSESSSQHMSSLNASQIKRNCKS